MTDLGWRADGIERARAAGGIELETYRRPGFTGGPSVRRANHPIGGTGNGGLERRDEPQPTIEIIARAAPPRFGPDTPPPGRHTPAADKRAR